MSSTILRAAASLPDGSLSRSLSFGAWWSPPEPFLELPPPADRKLERLVDTTPSGVGTPLEGGVSTTDERF
jgi:hypothetical protein